MKHLTRLPLVLLSLALLRAAPSVASIVICIATSTAIAAPFASTAATRSNYLLSCGGCHGYAGISNSTLVPTLQGLVGYYLNTSEGRDYLPRLPNVAFSTLNDAELAAVLNYLVFELGAGSAPRAAKAYSAAEVGRLRKHPLTEIALHPYRRHLVDTLIAQHHASDGLRRYGIGQYWPNSGPVGIAAVELH